MGFVLSLDPRAIHDIQEAINYYDNQQVGLGRKFERELNKYFLALEKNPFFRVRYDCVRCLPIRKFPYMVHFTVVEDEHLVIVRAVFHTSRDIQKRTGRK
jgi:plasmid stabilization system protein ParE